MPKKFLGLLAAVFLCLSVALPSPAKDIALKIATRSGQGLVYNFSDFDDKRLTFEFKLGKQEREVALRDIQAIYFDTTSSSSQNSADTLDIFSLKDGNTLRGIFKKMESNEVKATILENGLKEKKIPTVSLNKIDFSQNILDVDRREFGKGFNLFGKDIELELANGFASDIEKEAPPMDDTLVNNYVDRLGKKIAAFSKRTDLDYQFKVINSNEINAFTIGGGKVYVYRGLLEHVDNESELAGVLAHEIG
ncbi:MAG: M48 family metalloprotease, partial [candidate division Zixibacteria bacterium]|nr:M48 family metalloprotease [candidate division Zixibacteria bacterium]